MGFVTHRGPPLASGWNWVEKIGREVWIMPVDGFCVSTARGIDRLYGWSLALRLMALSAREEVGYLPSLLPSFRFTKYSDAVLVTGILS